MSQIDPNDLETLELYLDREIAQDDAQHVEARILAEPDLEAALTSLRLQRAVRLEAMSTAFDTDAAAVERLIASVREARSDESQHRTSWWLPSRSFGAAAACLAFGLILGGMLQRQQGPAGTVASPVVAPASGNTFVGYSQGEVRGQGSYVVSLRGRDGSEVMKVRLPSRAAAEQFIRWVKQPGQAGSQVSDARLVDESF